MLLPFFASAQINSFPYFENFEAGAGGWTSATLVGGDSWNLGTPDGSVINYAAAGGSNSWYVDTLETGTNEQSHVISPVYDFTNVPNPMLEIDIWWNLIFDSDGAVFQSSIDGGSSWQNVGSHTDDPAFAPNWFNHAFLSQGFPNGGAGSQSISHWTGDGPLGSQGWVTAKHILTGLGGQSNVQLRMAWINKTNNLGASGNGIAFDNILIFDAPAIDLAMNDVVQAGPCGGGYPGTAIATITNSGAQSTTINSLEDDLGTPFPITSTTVSAFSSVDVLVELPLQNPGSPSMNLGVSDPGDQNPSNDFFNATFNCNVVNGLNHCNDFESAGTAPWFADPEGANSSWNLGGNADNNTINTPFSGANFWGTTGPDGGYNPNEQSALVSPFFDFSTIQNSGVSFQFWRDLEIDYDGAVFQSSTDGGTTWVNVGTQGSGINWFNDGSVSGGGSGGQNVANWNGSSGGWVNATNSTPTLDGVAHILFRIALGADDIFQDGGMGFDDFCITGEEVPAIDTPNVVINEFKFSDFEGDDLDFIELKNKGSEALNMQDFRINFYQNDGNGTASYGVIGPDLINGTIQPNSHFVVGSLGTPGDYTYFTIPNSPNILGDSAALVLEYRLSNGDIVILDKVGYGNVDQSVSEFIPIVDSDSDHPSQVNQSFSRIPDGGDVNDNSTDFARVCMTPGLENNSIDNCNPYDSVDVAIAAIQQLEPCGGGFSAAVGITLQNNGYTDQLISEITDNQGGVHAITPFVLVAQESFSVVLNLPLSSPGSIDLILSANVDNDQVPTNDFQLFAFDCNVIEATNHLNDFERNDTLRWRPQHVAPLSSWRLGENTDNITINTPSPNQLGTNFWVTNVNGTHYSDENSSVISPYFDFSNTSSPVIKFDKWLDLETGQDGVVLESSLDGGTTWETVGEAGSGINSYNTGALPNGGAGQQNIEHWSGDGIEGTQGWENTVLPAPELAGIPNVLLRFAIHADGNVVTEGGFGFDNIEIQEIPVPSIVINEFNYVDARGEAYDFVELKNTGTIPADMADFQLNFIKEVNGVISQYDTISAPPLSGTVAPNDYYVIGDTASAFFLGVDELELTASQGVLGDTGAIELVYTPINLRADVVCYGDEIIGYTEGNAIEFADPGSPFYRGTGFSRVTDGNDTDDNQADFAYRCYTPGFTNEVVDSVCFVPEIVINEFNYSDPSGESFDFVELRNNDTEDIDLSNFELVFFNVFSGTNFPLNGVLSPNHYFVVGAMNGVPNTDMSFAPSTDYVFGELHSIALSYLPTGDNADLVGNAGGPAFEGAVIPTTDDGNFLDYLKGYSRIPDSFDSGNNNIDFQPACHTPGEPNIEDSVCVSLLVINEVDKLGANGDSVFVELYNKTPIVADLDGFILEFDDATNLDSIILDGSIGNQEYRVFGIPSASFDSDHVTIMLQDTQSTTIVDRLTIAETPAGLPNTEGEFTTLDASVTLSISRIPDGQDLNDNNNDFELVCTTLGSENFNDLSCDLVGIEESKVEANGMAIYPNPANDFLTLKTEVQGRYEFRILDGVGIVVKNGQVSNHQRIDISTLVTGVYSIITRNPKGQLAYGRFIKL